MMKSTTTRTWVAGLIVLAAGMVTGGVALGLMLAYGGHFTPAASGNGYDFIPNLDGYFWTTVTIATVGFFVAVAGGIVQLAAWIGALANTYQLQDKTWFTILLVGGLVGLAFAVVGFAAMVAYVIAGPDGTAVQQPQIPTAAPQPRTLVPTS
jgi:hypothetical protein